MRPTVQLNAGIYGLALVTLARRRTGVKNGGGTVRDVVASWCVEAAD
jgi:hypothetical protein